MPELPEVQTTVQGLDSHIRGLTIVDVWTDYKSAFHAGKDSIKDPQYFKNFKKLITGKTISHVTRRAKNILIHTTSHDDYTILIHMKMTGHILYGRYHFDKKAKKDPWTPLEDGPLRDPFNRFIHFVITLSNGMHLALSDMRKFAKVTLIPTHSLHRSTHLSTIGPEPLEDSFTFSSFKTRINHRPRAKIKPVIMDQTVMAGVGNIYADESLWRAGIHPESIVEKIPEKNLKELFIAIKTTLRKGIDFGGDSMSDYRNIHGTRGKFQEHHRAYRKTKSSCTKRGCKGTILRKVIAGRGSHFCSEHQTLYTKYIKTTGQKV